MYKNSTYLHCRVCGLAQSDPPWGEDGETPTFNICPCCGVEFGYEDSTLFSIRNYRSSWLEGGAQWHVPKAKPQDWRLDEQLNQIPPEYV
jgi:hypothetical protein